MKKNIFRYRTQIRRGGQGAARNALPDFRRSLSAGVARIAAVILFLISGPGAYAHELGEGYIILNVRNEALFGRLELNLDDLDDALGLDQNSDGAIDTAEIAASHDRVQEYVQPRVRVGTEQQWWTLHFGEPELASHPIGNFLAMPFAVEQTGTVPDEIVVEYRLLFDHDESQKGMLVIESNERIGWENTEKAVSMLFNSDNSSQTVDLTQIPVQNVFLMFIREGVWHIWIGLDHILFLVALLLPSVTMRTKEGTLRPVPDFSRAIWQVIKVVTLFTVAHSISLALACFQIVTLPGWLIESIIAGSIVIAAFDNIVPVFRGHIGWVVFGFGLFHGLGFASVLAPLMLSESSLVTTLLGFNVGVELGQIAIICVAFPVLFLLRKSAIYNPWIQQGLSLILILLGLCWMIERSFDVTIVGI